MAGKSTLMSILTHGDGSQIGNGSQRTTREVRTYHYHNLKVTDMPGTGAFEGDDDKLAMASVERGDIVIFLFADDAPQLSDATFLSRVKNLGKPVILLFNVKVGGKIREGMEKDDIEDLCERIDEAFCDPDELDGARESLVNYGPRFQQDWSKIPYSYAHLKSAFLAQDRRLVDWSKQLREASRFEDAIDLVNRELCGKGTFFRLKSYIDTVSTSLILEVETLFRLCCENLDLSSGLVSRHKEFVDRSKLFHIQSRKKIKTFATQIENELRVEAAAFAEEHFDDKDVDRNWKRIISTHDYQTKAQRLLEDLERECYAEVREISREISFDIKSGFLTNAGIRVIPHNVIDTKRMAGWAGATLGVGAFVLGLMNLPAASIVGAVGLVVGVGSAFLKSGESKRDEARRALKEQINGFISEYSASIQRSLEENVESKLIEGILVPIAENLKGLYVSLNRLAETQRSLATELAVRQGELSAALMKEALGYLGYEEMADAVVAAARLPGTASILVLDKPLNFYREVIDGLRELLHESIRDVVVIDADGQVPISRIAGRALYEGSVTLRPIGDRPVIDITRTATDNTGGRLAMQLIDILDVWG